ncbi:AtpZ/AtpI family protein [Candidatus Gottesmanbacteria bacterium]|nr:AtpZ/AtpI family protein [Candidatus Gottesmanbacteria bacterium]
MEISIKKRAKSKNEKTKFISLLSTSFGLGFAISGPMVIGALIGTYLDRLIGSSPKLTLVLIFCGIILAIGSIYKYLKESQDE